MEDIKKDLYKAGEKRCLITRKKEKAYNISQPLVLSKDLPTKNFDAKETIENLVREYEGCTKCELGEIRKYRKANLVFGRGSATALGMIIAESPWEIEERDKKPLHPDAPAGGVLYRVMSKVGLNQSEWYLTNAVICRPLLDANAPLHKNKPTTKHMDACRTRLKRTLRSVSPRLVVLLGAHAYETWFGYPPARVLKEMGWVHRDDPDTGKPINYHVYFVCHPSYVARAERAKNGVAEVQKMYLEHWKEIARVFKELRDGCT